jgi:Protein of unknown function (DUF3106)
MKSHRLWLGIALTALSTLAAAQPPLREPPRPSSVPSVLVFPRPTAFRVPPQSAQDHLQRWMERRSNLTLPQLLRDLESDPQFRSSPPQQQQRLRNLLIRLYNMRPRERDHLLEGNEALERMTPPQRQQFTATMQQYAALPPERRHLVAQAFARLRRLPPPSRQAAIDSDPIRPQLTPPERDTLSNLLLWEPYFSH